MMKLAVILCLALVQDGLADFLLKKMAMDDETFEVCSYCDERSDKLGSSVVAKELREFMTRDHIKIVVDKGDVLMMRPLRCVATVMRGRTSLDQVWSQKS